MPTQATATTEVCSFYFPPGTPWVAGLGQTLQALGSSYTEHGWSISVTVARSANGARRERAV